MLYKYQAKDENGDIHEGTVEATTLDAAMLAIKRKGYTISKIDLVQESGFIDKVKDNFGIEISLFNSVPAKDLVILSRQVATLFEAQVSPLRIFQLLKDETQNPILRETLESITYDLQGGSSISRALAQHPNVFSLFYVNLVKSGEEIGSLDKTFSYLADHLDRSYELTSRAKNALMYPIFVIVIFIAVMALMLTMVIPSIAQVLISGGQELPIYTRIIIGVSDFMVTYVGIIFMVLSLGGLALWKFVQTEPGKRVIDEIKLQIPYISTLNEKLYLTRMCDSMSTMLSGGVAMVQAIDVTAEIVDNVIYREILEQVSKEVRSGRSFADAISQYNEIPGVLSQMAKVGEETGALPSILETLSKFYRREVFNAVDTLIGLIEPLMILLLGLGVGTLLASVLLPIYNMTASF